MNKLEEIAGFVIAVIIFCFCVSVFPAFALLPIIGYGIGFVSILKGSR